MTKIVIDMNEKPKIQVYCPVDPSYIENTPDGFVCRKCQNSLADVSCQREFKSLSKGMCGVMLSLAVTSCATQDERSSTAHESISSHTKKIIEVEKTEDGDDLITKKTDSYRPLLGIFFHEGGDIYDTDKYPIANKTNKSGVVISPYTETEVDVSGISSGTLVSDPTFKITDKKYFRVP